MHIRFTGFTYHAFAVCSGILPDSWRDKAGTDYVKSAWSMVSYGFAFFLSDGAGKAACSFKDFWHKAWKYPSDEKSKKKLEKKKVKKKPKKKSGEKSHKEPEKDLVQKRQKPEEQTAPAIEKR